MENMNIVVSYKRIWGKELFYPVSDDAIFLAKLTGRPTILKRQLVLCVEAGWDVHLIQETLNLKEILLKNGK